MEGEVHADCDQDVSSQSAAVRNGDRGEGRELTAAE